MPINLCKIIKKIEIMEANEKHIGIFSDLKECKNLFLETLKKKGTVDMNLLIDQMEEVEKIFLKEFPWAFQKNYFVLPNTVFKQIFYASDSPEFEILEMFNGKWESHPDFRDLNSPDTLPTNQPFICYKVRMCKDVVGVLKQREYAGTEKSAFCVFVEFPILMKITYSSMNGGLQKSFVQNIEGMDTDELDELIPKPPVTTHLKRETSGAES